MSTDAITATRRDTRKRDAQRPAGEESPHETAEVSERHEVDRLNPDASAEQPCYYCITAAVRRSWASSGYTALRGIECRFEDGVLIIRGSVSSFYYKQMAQELVRCVDGVDQIVNELAVPLCDTTKNKHDNQEN
mgnify:FL=1|tara:strand:+ start:20742 stop:21143 length:402 start_codon:yes stop_codon:yes gene_type:complete